MTGAGPARRQILWDHGVRVVENHQARLFATADDRFYQEVLGDAAMRSTTVPLIQDIATASAATRLEEIQRPVSAVVTTIASREEVVDILEQYKLTDLPVVDAEGRMIGVVRHRNLVTAAED